MGAKIFFFLMFRFNYIYFTHQVSERTPFGLTAVLLDISDVLAKKSHRHDARYMTFRPVDVHIKFQLLSNRFDVLQTLLVVWPSTANPDLDFVL